MTADLVSCPIKDGEVVTWRQTTEGVIGETVPAPDFYNNFVTLSYDSQTLGEGGATIDVTPIYDMPFQYGSTVENAPAIALDIHGNEAKYPLYHNGGNLRVEFTANTDADDYTQGAVKTLDYAWKLVGDPIRGFKLYNVAAQKYAVQANDADEEITLGAEGNVFQVYNTTQPEITETAFCLKETSRNNYLNHRQTKVQGWNQADGGSAFRAYAINQADASYTLDMSGQYATICLPFYAAKPEGLTIYTNNAVDENNVLTLVPGGSLLKANTPYIVEGTAGSNYTFNNNTTSTATDNVTAGYLTGVRAAEGANVPNGSYVLAREKSTNKQAFYLTNGSVTCPQYKCYLTVPAAAENAVKAFYFENSGLETSIEEVMGADEETTIYNLNGQQLKRMQKGINIVNGRKIVVK